MPGAIVLATGLFLLVVTLHVRLLNVGLAGVSKQPGEAVPTVRLALFLLFVLATHLIGAAIFAAGFWSGHAIGLGGFSKEPSMQAMDYFTSRSSTSRRSGWATSTRPIISASWPAWNP